MEVANIGITLSFAESENGSYQGLYGLKATPDMGGKPERVDITNLCDRNRRTIAGVRDMGDLVFRFFYNSAADNANVRSDECANAYQTLRAYDKAGKAIWFRLIYPDGTGYQWKGTPAVYREKAEVNGVVSFTLKISVQTEIVDI